MTSAETIGGNRGQRPVGKRILKGFVFAFPVIMLIAGVLLLLLVFRTEANGQAAAPASSPAAAHVE